MNARERCTTEGSRHTPCAVRVHPQRECKESPTNKSRLVLLFGGVQIGTQRHQATKKAVIVGVFVSSCDRARTLRMRNTKTGTLSTERTARRSVPATVITDLGCGSYAV